MIRIDFAKLTFAAALLAASAAQAQQMTQNAAPQRIHEAQSAAPQRMQVAQLFNRPPAGLSNDSYQGGGGDSAGLLVRIDRLEKEVRSLTGELEQMQFQTRRLEEQMRSLMNNDARTDGGAGARPAAAPQRRSEAPDAGLPLPQAGVQAGLQAGLQANGQAAGQAGASPATMPRGRGDAFDPAQSPGAAGAPRVLGQLDGRGAPLPGGPLGGAAGGVIDEVSDPSAPMDLLNPRRTRVATPPLPPVVEQPRTQLATPIDPAPSNVAPPGPRTDFEAAVAALRANQLDAAEAGFKDFLQRYPTSQLVASATYNLGDVYARRGRHREAAEQFLKVSTDYSKASQAPMSLLKLGESLERLGAKEQACAAWGEVGRKYPNAPASVKTGVERDMKRVQC